MVRGVFQPNKTRDITGQKFGSLTAVRFDHRDERTVGGQHYWLFRCDCGNEIVLRKSSVTSGNTKRCSCCSAKLSAERNTKHGYVGTRLYKEWAGIIQRCTNPNSSSWDRYGAVGVSFCDEWRHFEPFMEWALSHGYSDDLSIDRIDSSKGYSPDNCRWVGIREQNNNQARTLWLTYNGETMQLSYWADRFGLNRHTLYDRLYRHGWPIEKALTTPVRRTA